MAQNQPNQFLLNQDPAMNQGYPYRQEYSKTDLNAYKQSQLLQDNPQSRQFGSLPQGHSNNEVHIN
jgi:hypothetical protein